MDSIFNDGFEQEEVTQKEVKKGGMTVDELKHALYQNRTANSVDKEPDWSWLLKNAKNDRERWEVMNTRSAWKEAQNERIWEAQQKEHNRKVDEVIRTPQHSRNKFFYEQLQKNSPSLYWDTRLQAQRKADQKALGFCFHLKG